MNMPTIETLPRFVGRASFVPLRVEYIIPKWLLFFIPTGIHFLFSKQIWLFENDPYDPLIWIDEHGDQWRPPGRFETDIGTIPTPFRGKYSPTQYAYAYAGFHDPAYEFGGLYLLVDGQWVFTPVTRDWADATLKRQIEVYPGDMDHERKDADAKAVYVAVHEFGKRAWDEARKADAKPNGI